MFSRQADVAMGQRGANGHPFMDDGHFAYFSCQGNTWTVS